MARAARSLDVLLGQINAFAPRRSKVSDGGIADARHLKAGTSDHIADRDGVFHARDVTHDPAGGFDAYAFAERLLAAQDPRLKYVISRDRIGFGPAGSGVAGGQRVGHGRWASYAYVGPSRNRHEHHTHVSVVSGPAGDNIGLWAGVAPIKPVSKPSPIPLHEEDDLTPDQAQMLAAIHDEITKRLPNRVGPNASQEGDGADTILGYAANADAYGTRIERYLHSDEFADRIVDRLLARELTATAWNGGRLVDQAARVEQLLTRASEGSIAAHIARGEQVTK